MSSVIEGNKNPLNLSELQKQIVESVKAGKSLLGKDGALTPLIKQALEAALEGEIDVTNGCKLIQANG
jgi:hypothetical protein